MKKSQLITALFLGMILLYGATQVFGQRVVVVSAETPWTDSGLDVTQGHRVAIIANGFAAAGGTQKSFFEVSDFRGPEGGGPYHPNHIIPDAPGYSLIAKIGDSGQPFFVGAGKSFEAESSGKLWLGYNDDPNVFWDNYGYLVAFVFVPASPTAVGSLSLEKPITTTLLQNYPNPFNPETTIEFSVQKLSRVEIQIFNQLGQKVRNLVDENKPIGEYSIKWDGKDDTGRQVATGTYFYQLKVDDFVSSKKMILLR